MLSLLHEDGALLCPVVDVSPTDRFNPPPDILCSCGETNTCSDLTYLNFQIQIENNELTLSALSLCSLSQENKVYETVLKTRLFGQM
jgi:hypothetical protein